LVNSITWTKYAGSNIYIIILNMVAFRNQLLNHFFKQETSIQRLNENADVLELIPK